MSDYIKVSGKTVEDALLEASIQLQTSSDNIEYNVIEKESKGFLGIGAKKAVIEARVKKTDDDIIKEVFGDTETPGKSETDSDKSGKNDKSENPVKSGRRKSSEKIKTEKNAGLKEKPADYQAPESKEKKSASLQNNKPEKKEKDEKQRVPADPEEAKRRAKEFLTQLFEAMGVEAEITEEYENGTLSVNFEGNDMGMLIGKRGQTLDSIQFLTSLVVNRGNASYVRVKLDTENYRERRKATLENLARNMAVKVKRTGRPAYLEPMNPYERRIIHSALQNDPYVTTHSEGEDPCRKVVIVPKKREETEE